MRQIWEGLNYLHETHEIMHRDLKPGNILLKARSNSNNSVQIKSWDVFEEDNKTYESFKENQSRLTASTLESSKNILNCQIKIWDFGLAKDSNREIFAFGNDDGGTRLFQAPEQTMSMAYGKSVDIWGVGIIMYYLLTFGKHPISK